jgi:hypothetical protein
MLFAFSITPKRWLHNTVATHKDGRATALPVSGKAQFNKSTFNCPCDNFIAESPFIHHETVKDLFVLFGYNVHQASPVTHFISFRDLCFGLRGPPAGHC